MYLSHIIDKKNVLKKSSIQVFFKKAPKKGFSKCHQLCKVNWIQMIKSKSWVVQLMYNVLNFKPTGSDELGSSIRYLKILLMSSKNINHKNVIKDNYKILLLINTLITNRIKKIDNYEYEETTVIDTSFYKTYIKANFISIYSINIF